MGSGAQGKRAVAPEVPGLAAGDVVLSTSALVLIVYSGVGTVPGLGSGF